MAERPSLRRGRHRNQRRAPSALELERHPPRLVFGRRRIPEDSKKRRYVGISSSRIGGMEGVDQVRSNDRWASDADGLVHLDCCRSEIKDCCVGSRGRGPFLQLCRSGLEYCFVVIHSEANGCGGTGRLLPLSKRSRPNSRGCSARTGLRGKDDGAVASCLSTHRIESRLEGSSTR
jgi:hypothetical protein